MINEPVLIDAGPLVALLHSSDSLHHQCREQALQLRGAVMTSWAVVAEAAWLLRRLPQGLEQLLAAIDDQGVELVHLPQDSLPWLRGRAQQYRDLRPQVADLTLLYLAEQLHIERIFTLDRRDFTVYRQTSGQAFQLIPEAL